jgi:CarD family transcriptional regulator
VLRDLYLLKAEKTLSFGERRMYDKAHGLIVQEIAAARDIEEKAVEEEIRSLFVT